MFEGSDFENSPPDVGDTISRLDNRAEINDASVDQYFELLSAWNEFHGPTGRGPGVYTVVLWTGPSGMQRAEDIMHRPLNLGVPVLTFGRMNRPNGVYYTGSINSCEFRNVLKFEKTFKNMSGL